MKRILTARDLLAHMHRCFPLEKCRAWRRGSRRETACLVAVNSNARHNPATGRLAWLPATPDWVKKRWPGMTTLP